MARKSRQGRASIKSYLTVWRHWNLTFGSQTDDMAAALSRLDWILILTVLILLILGITTIYTVTYITVGSHLAFSQAIFAAIGFAVMFVLAMMDYRALKRWAIPFYIVCVVLLIPLVPPLSHHAPLVICELGACRWINLGFTRLQVSELLKLAIPLVIGYIVGDTLRGRRPRVANVALFGGIVLTPAFMILEQPDLGSASVVVFTSLVVLLASRISWKIWLALVIAASLAAPVTWQHLKPYQKQRLEVFVNPSLDLSQSGYNVHQAEIAVGSGGLFGRGFGQGSQSQLNFLPVAQTDFVFAGYAEATGFVGSVVLVVLLFILVWRALVIANQARDRFGQLIAIGIAGMLFIQILINIAMNMRLAPVTGITLPFVSYGGTSLLINMVAVGLLLSISLRRKPVEF